MASFEYIAVMIDVFAVSGKWNSVCCGLSISSISSCSFYPLLNFVSVS